MADDPFSDAALEQRLNGVIPITPPPVFTYPSMPQTPGAAYGNGQSFAPITRSSAVAPMAASPQATGLEDVQRAWLDALAGPESAGKYNVRFSPRGGALFDSFRDHPNIAELGPAGPSTAAGRYQITKTTWDELKQRGLIPKDADFSPANQDKAALALAEFRYNQYTGGRHLWNDLKEKGLTSEIMNIMAPTWVGLKDNPQKALDWWNKAMQNKGVPTGTPAPTGTGTAAAKTLFDDPFGDKALQARLEKTIPMPKPFKMEPTQGAQPPQVSGYAPEPVSWGPSQQFAHGLMANRGPEVNALTEGARYMWNARKEGVPLSEAYAQARDKIYPQALQDWKGAQKEYEESAPFAAPVLQGVGNLAPMLTAVGGVGMGLNALGRAAPSLVPALNFVGGAPAGAASTLGRIAQGAVSGGWQGALGNAIIGEDPKAGAGIGAGIGAATNPLIGKVLAPLAAVAERNVAQVAQRGLDAGVDVPGSAIINNGSLQKTVQNLAGKGDKEAAEGFTRQVAKLFGADKEMKKLGVKGLTPEVMQAAKDRIGDGFEKFAAKAHVDINGKMFMDMMDVSRDAHNISVKLGKQVDEYIADVIAHSTNNGQLSGKQFRMLTDSNSTLQDMWKAPNMQEFARKLSDVMYDGLETALPGAVKEIRDLRQQYRALMTVKPMADANPGTGLLGPNVARALTKEGYTLEGQLAQTMPKLTPSGAEAFEPNLGGHLRKAVGAGGLLAGGTLLGSMSHLGPEALHMIANHPLAAGGAALGLGALGGAKKLYGNYLNSPAYTQRIINNTLNPTAGSGFNPFVPMVNPLVPQGAGNPFAQEPR